MKWFLFSAVLSLWARGAEAQTDLKALLTDPARGWASNTIISFPGSDPFVQATERWSIVNAPTYSAAISPAREADVATAVNLARTENISILATGRRNGYSSTLAGLQNGLAIDLSLLNSVEINQTAKTLTVGPGVSIDDILDPLESKQFMMPIASARCPSVIGTTLGGGVGRYAGLFGLMSDNLASVRVVTANGTLLDASALENSELFWAIRGAGANFAIVVSATYRLTPQVNLGKVVSYDYTIPASMSSAFFKQLDDFTHKLPAELAGIAWVTYNSSTNEPQILTNWIYVGGELDSLEAMQPILELRPAQIVAKQLPFSKQINFTFDGLANTICEDGVVRDVYSASMRTYNRTLMVETFAKMTEFYKNHPGGRNSTLQFEFYPNQAVAAVAGDQTPTPWRDATGYFQAIMSWDGDAATADAAKALASALREDVGAFAGYGRVRVPASYAHGDEELADIYGLANLPRLAKLKKLWDEHSMFSFNNPLPLRFP